MKLVVVRPHTDGKVFALGCASKLDGESREQPDEHKLVQRILGDCWQWETNAAVCERRQLQFPPAILISVEKIHHQIRLRILSCGRMSAKTIEDPKSQR